MLLRHFKTVSDSRFGSAFRIRVSDITFKVICHTFKVIVLCFGCTFRLPKGELSETNIRNEYPNGKNACTRNQFLVVPGSTKVIITKRIDGSG